MTLPGADFEPHIEDVDEPGALLGLPQCWRQAAPIGVDTEFMRTRTFRPQAALYQVSDGASAWLIDPLTVGAPAGLAAIVADEGIVKLMFGCGEDVEVMHVHLGVVPRGTLDLQLAAAFAGGSFEAGYARVVEQHLGITLDKGATRTDWLQRPLSAIQRRYAALDAALLVPLWEVLHPLLDASARVDWLVEESGHRIATSLPAEPARYYRDARAAQSLQGIELARFAALSCWREQHARDLDLPRSWVCPDEVLAQVARRPPSTRDALRGLLDGRAVRHAAALHEAVERCMATAPATVQELSAPLAPADLERADGLRNRARDAARRLGIAEELLARRRLLGDLVRAARDGAALPAEYGGWRRQALGERFLADAGFAS